MDREDWQSRGHISGQLSGGEVGSRCIVLRLWRINGKSKGCTFFSADILFIWRIYAYQSNSSCSRDVISSRNLASDRIYFLPRTLYNFHSLHRNGDQSCFGKFSPCHFCCFLLSGLGQVDCFITHISRHPYPSLLSEELDKPPHGRKMFHHRRLMINIRQHPQRIQL